LLLLALCLAVNLSASITPVSAQARRHSSHWVDRCGFTSSPYGRLGVYIEKGRVSCRKGRHLIHREFYAPGKSVGTGSVLYPNGWVCGGQMGSYFCAKPLWYPNEQPKEYVGALACHMGSGPTAVRCPVRVRLQVP
jgi:hypothetical protein